MQGRAKALKAASPASAREHRRSCEARDHKRRAWGAHRARRPVAGALPYLTFLRASSSAARETIAPRAPLFGITRTTASEDHAWARPRADRACLLHNCF